MSHIYYVGHFHIIESFLTMLVVKNVLPYSLWHFAVLLLQLYCSNPLTAVKSRIREITCIYKALLQQTCRKPPTIWHESWLLIFHYLYIEIYSSAKFHVSCYNILLTRQVITLAKSFSNSKISLICLVTTGSVLLVFANFVIVSNISSW